MNPEPLTVEELALFEMHRVAIEAELLRMLPTVQFECVLQLPIREYLTTIELPHYTYTWTP